jgi:hypothetical protein
MKLHRQKLFCGRTGWLVAALAWLVFSASSPAQTNTGGGRWLLVFDTASTMKNRLPATEAAVKHFFSTRADGQLETGDSVGVWAFDREINAKFSTFTWTPAQAAETVSNLVAFLHRQPYQTEAQIKILQTPLTRVVADSQRLTVVLFTDGKADFIGTPYDLGINQTFRDGWSERKKSRQPFIVILRSQLGKFIGCTVNFPPGNLNLPAFPPPPEPPQQPMTPPPPVVIAPATPVPSLVIVGKHVSTDTNDLAEKPVTAPVQPMPLVKTNPPSAPTNSPPVKAEVKSISAPTNNIQSIAASSTATGQSGWLIYVVVGLLAVVLVAVLGRRARRPESSLITTSMEDDSR